MILCARSAHTLPRATTLSNFDSCANFAFRAAARNLATFSCGVSPVGGNVAETVDAGEGLEEAYGPVAVKRVASAAERGIVL